MDKIFLIPEDVINGFHSINLEIITIASIICGIFVIVSKNPIVSVLYLIGLFLSISVFLMMQGLNFIGLSYLLVYVGAVSILFLFILMLINVRISEIVSSTSNSIPLGILVGTILYTIISKALPNTINNSGDTERNISVIYSRNLDNISTINEEVFETLGLVSLKSESSCENVLSQTWDGMLSNFSHINIIGNIIYTSYSLWLLLTSLVLLLAMVGTIIITIKV